MSKLLGHYLITVEAIRRVRKKRPKDAMAQSFHEDDTAYLHPKNHKAILNTEKYGEWYFRYQGIRHHGSPAGDLAWGAILRDIDDSFSNKSIMHGGLWSGGHVEDEAQKHHFMRRFDGQSPYDAYLDGVAWLRSNATAGAKELARRAHQKPHAAVSHFHATPSARQRSPRLHGHAANHPGDPDPSPAVDLYRVIGNAVHCLQDTFAVGHVRRTYKSHHSPGEIRHVLVYRGEEGNSEAHDKGDTAWFDEKTGWFSWTGELAVEGTVSLLELIIDNAETHHEIHKLVGWNTFAQKWLVASRALRENKDWNFPADFIERFLYQAQYKVGQIGLPMMHEEDLAAALLKECGTDAKKLYAIFSLLNRDYNHNADDVAVVYVEAVQKNKGAALDLLKRPENKALVDLMIKILDEGPTFSDEAKAIAFLKSCQAKDPKKP